MELQHFSHEHPLMFIDEVQNEEGREQVVCYGCQKSILGSAYHCGECNYFLHKKCAELPMEIDCPMHYQHPLTLLPHPSYSYMQSKSCDCNVCGKNDWKWFTYNCSLCEFDVDILCILEKEGYTITHEGHPHPLTLLLKEVSFLCTACDTIGKDVSYLCTKCQFWIHKSCALSPTTITHIDHDHPLVLGYSLPYEYRRFYYYCEICKQKVHPFFWVYYCDKCRYFVHMKCATSEITRDDKGKITADDPSTIIQFPLTAEGLIDLQSELLNEVINLGDKERSPEITYFRHEHPLALFGDQSNSITNNSEVLCDCCIRPLTSAPFYGCSQCSYFLHTSCTELPAKLQHPCHPDHLLYLSSPLSFVERVWCHGCRTYGNGFYYRCESCNYYLDISCALFPEKVKHEGHKHPLHIEWIDTVFVCNPCDGTPKGLRFACDACNFHIEINCVCLPHTFKHDWDRHPLTLSYPPYSDHPDAFYCEICEEEIYPKSWVYRCRSCVQFFHLCCAIPFDEFSKTKFGGTLKVENHPHTITFVRKSENKSPSSCDRCGKDSKAAEPIVECAPCNFVICRECCRSII